MYSKLMSFFKIKQNSENENDKNDSFSSSSSKKSIDKNNLFDEEIFKKISYENAGTTLDVLDKNLCLRPLNKLDYKKGYLELLEQLTHVGDISEEQFNKQFDLMKNCFNTYYIVVIEDLNTKKIIGSATLHVEHKFIHSTSLRGRVEDVVVDNNYRGKKLGNLLLETTKLFAKLFKCYKLSLDCKDNMISYYTKFGFVCEPANSNVMTIRL